jgi:hypothetical protein
MTVPFGEKRKTYCLDDYRNEQQMFGDQDVVIRVD